MNLMAGVDSAIVGACITLAIWALTPDVPLWRRIIAMASLTIAMVLAALIVVTWR